VPEPDVTIFVCVACRRRLGDAEEAFDQPGQDLLPALEARLRGADHHGVAVKAVSCLAVCKRPCTLALAGKGKWTYVVGDLDADFHLDEIVVAALRYGRTENGIIPWKERPMAFRKGVIARIPPLAFQPIGTDI
jgi:predicted metal-binding protein